MIGLWLYRTAILCVLILIYNELKSLQNKNLK